jgi:Flp pilus assembly protein TadG
MAGQAMVEFALVAPIFFLVFFGIIEFSLIMASLGGFNFATREGARLASVLGRTDPNVDTEVVSTVNTYVQGLVMARAQEIDIFRSAPGGLCLNVATGSYSSGNQVAVGSANCKKDVYTVSSQSWTTQTWPANDRDDSQLGADYVGVRILYNYTFITGFIAASGSVLNLSATSVQRIEPQDYGSGMRGTPVLGRVLSGIEVPWISMWTDSWTSIAVPFAVLWRRGSVEGTV